MPPPRRTSPGERAEPFAALVIVRAVIYLAAAAVSLIVDGADRAGVAAGICLTGAALQPLLISVSRRLYLRHAEAAFDTAVVIALAIAAPQLWYTSLILLIAASTLLAATLQPQQHLLILALLVEALLVLGAVADPLHWVTYPVVGAAVLMVAVRGSMALRRHLQRTEAHLAEAMSAARAIVHVIDVQTREIIEVAGDVGEVTGWTLDEWLARGPIDLFEADDLSAFEAALDRLDHVPELDFVGRTYDADGETRWLRYTGRVEVDDRGRQILRGMLSDVTAIHRISDELYEQARRDRITGLPNRQRLEEDLDQHAMQGQRFALLVSDIRQFNAINDTLGHHIGDLILSMTGNRLCALADDGWSVYRLSSDQFAVVLTGTNDSDTALVIANQIAQECRQPYSVGSVALGAPVAVGVALSAPNVAPSVTLRQADVALNAAKETNNSVEVYHADMQRFTLENLVLSASVQQGLDRDEFVLYFQPQVDLATGQVVGAEGLVRWQHPERGLLPPNDFVETVRLSASFDRFTLGVVNQAIRAAAAAQGSEHSIGFAVNIELSSLLTPGFTERLIGELKNSSVGHHRVVLEVTETELAESIVASSPINLFAELQRLRSAGYEIAIDDFGTGSSSLFRLDRMPADELKIDRAFVQAVGSSQRSEMLLSSIIQLGNNLGMRVVAEGIEELDQVGYLTSAGCRFGQGWLFSKAVPVDEFLAALHTRYPVSADEPGDTTVTPIRSRRA